MLNFGKQSNSPFKRDASSVACSIEGIFVINLKRSQDRLQKFQERAQKENITASVWEAVDGSQLDNETLSNAGASYWSLVDATKKRRAEIACFLSHRSLWYSLMKLPHIENTGYLILEDDVYFKEQLIPKLSNALRYVPPNWDVLFVGCGSAKYVDENSFSPVKKLLGCDGTFAYVLRAKSIPRILPYFWLIAEPVDTLLCRLFKDINAYALTEPLIMPDFSMESTIRGAKLR